MRTTKTAGGFTLIELLIVIAIIGILISIVMAAIHPTKQLNDAKNANRTTHGLQIQNAVRQYIIDGRTIAGIPEGKGNAVDICQDTTTGADCTGATVNGIDLSALTPTYVVSIPIDPDETGTVVSGYRLYRVGTIDLVCSARMESDCGG